MCEPKNKSCGYSPPEGRDVTNADNSASGSVTAGAGGSSLVDVETDVDSLKSKLSNLTNQQVLAKGIKDSQIVSLFRCFPCALI